MLILKRFVFSLLFRKKKTLEAIGGKEIAEKKGAKPDIIGNYFHCANEESFEAIIQVCKVNSS